MEGFPVLQDHGGEALSLTQVTHELHRVGECKKKKKMLCIFLCAIVPFPFVLKLTWRHCEGVVRDKVCTFVCGGSPSDLKTF